MASINTNNSTPSAGNGVSTDLNTTEYLTQLLEDKKQLASFPKLFIHLERILDEEIHRARMNLFQMDGQGSVFLPEPIGTIVQLTEKLYVPVKDHPEFNFVGRILGPRGMTAKQLEQETGCKIMVRGKGSMRDKAKEEQMKGKPNWEHLNDELHVLITVEDSKNRAELKLKRAVEEIKKLLVPSPEGEDELKKKQLMELAIINGTYKQKLNSILIPSDNPFAFLSATLNPYAAQPILLSPRLASSPATSTGSILNPAATAQIITPPPDATTSIFYLPTLYQDPTGLSASAPTGILEYPNGLEISQSGSIKPHARFTSSSSLRNHPYSRVSLS